MIRKLLFPAPPSSLVSLGLLGLRVVVGLAFMYHGWGKIQHPMSWMGADATMPSILQGLAALSEFGGGAAWVLGLLTRVASLGICGTMGVAVSKHLEWKQPFVDPKGGHSYEPALVYLAVGVLLLLAGAGKFSIDAFLAPERDK